MKAGVKRLVGLPALASIRPRSTSVSHKNVICFIFVISLSDCDGFRRKIAHEIWKNHIHGLHVVFYVRTVPCKS